MNIRFGKLTFACALIAFWLTAAQPGAAQSNVNFIADGGPAAWNSDSNWDIFAVPTVTFNEVAVITAGRTAFVSDTPPAVGGISVAAGTLEIRNGGNLTASTGTLAEGSLTVGTTSTLQLSEVGSPGSAQLSANSASLNGTTRIVGPTAGFTINDTLSFGNSSRLIPVITGPTFSPINVGGSAALGGTVQVQFDGHTPTIGESWELVTAGSLSGSFAVDASQAPPLPRGGRYRIATTDTTASLVVGGSLILVADRASGAVTIENILDEPVTLDAYTIASPSGLLGGEWQSLQSQSIADWDEADNADNNRLTEFNPLGATTINSMSSRSLGNPYMEVPQQFGVDANELTFSYSLPGEGTVTGVVEYSGPNNNLVLTVDPDTGEAAIQNESPFFQAEIDAYTITSQSGLLNPAAGGWNSLQDQSLGDWDEADNSSPSRLTEFNPLGSTLLAGGGTVLHLGTPINVSGETLREDDLLFEFQLLGGQQLEGVVVFGSLPVATLPGDFDNNGVVDDNDYATWRSAYGTSVAAGSGADGNGDGVVNAADYTVWRDHLGIASGRAASRSVPEPATASLALLTVCCAACCRWLRSM